MRRLKALVIQGVVIEPNGDELVVSPWLSSLQAAQYLNSSKSYLDHLRLHGDGPAFSCVGRKGRKIVYHVENLDESVK